MAPGREKISLGSRGLAIAEVYLILAMACVAIAFGVGPHIAAEGRELISAAPTLLDKLGSGRVVHDIGANRG